MAALLVRAFCLPFELAARAGEAACDLCARVRCPALSCWCPCAECAERLLASRGASLVLFTLGFALAPGAAAAGYAAASSADCAASNGAGVANLPLQSWLAAHAALALCHAAAALHVWRHMQRPFNARDPRDVDWVARASWLACYDPGVALALVALVAQLALLIIGAGLSVAPGARCSVALTAAFSTIVALGWFFVAALAVGLGAAYLWGCTCGRAEEAWAADAQAQAQANAQARAAHQQQQHQQYQQQQYQQQHQQYAVAAVAAPYNVAEGLAAAPALPFAVAYAPPPPAAAAAQHVPVAREVAEWPAGAHVPMAQPVAAGGPYGAGAGAVPAGHVHEPAAVTLARAGLGLLGGGLRAGAAAAGAVVEAARVAAEHHRAQQIAEQNAAALAYAQQQQRRY